MHCGIAATDFIFTSKNSAYGSVYHSNYDSFYWYKTWGDPTFEWHLTIAKVWGSLAFKLVNEEILPFNFEDYGNALDEYVSNLSNLTTKVDFGPMKEAVLQFKSSAKKVAKEIEEISKGSETLLRSLNDRLMMTERVFLGSPRESGQGNEIFRLNLLRRMVSSCNFFAFQSGFLCKFCFPCHPDCHCNRKLERS